MTSGKATRTDCMCSNPQSLSPRKNIHPPQNLFINSIPAATQNKKKMTDQILICARFSLIEKPLVCHVHEQAKGQPDSAQIHLIQCQQPLINHLIR